MEILRTWERMSSLPGGKFLFSRLLGRWVPYTGSIQPDVQELRPGFARVRMKDRASVRNHLESIHAAALMNFCEASTGLAFMAGMPSEARAILTRFEIDYLYKARGTLTAECHCAIPVSDEKKEYRVSCEARDEKGEVVCRAEARWLVGPRKKA